MSDNNNKVFSYIAGFFSAGILIFSLSYYSKQDAVHYKRMVDCQQTGYLTVKLTTDLMKNRMLYKSTLSSKDVAKSKNKLALLEMEENHLLLMIMGMYKQVGWVRSTGMVNYNEYIEHCFINTFGDKRNHNKLIKKEIPS